MYCVNRVCVISMVWVCVGMGMGVGVGAGGVWGWGFGCGSGSGCVDRVYGEGVLRVQHTYGCAICPSEEVSQPTTLRPRPPPSSETHKDKG